MAAGTDDQAVTEAAIAGILGLRLKSHEDRGFDLDGRIGNADVLVDAKHSERIAGYSEKADSKISKIDEWEKRRRLPAYVALVPGRGLYLHVGIDPASRPTFIGGKGGQAKRGLVRPVELAHYIDGSGKPLPFVELSTRLKGREDLARITPDEIARIRSGLNRTLSGIKDMRKLNRHVEKQGETARAKLARKCALGDPVVTAKAVAEVNAEATARAGLEALGLPEEEIRHILTKSLRGKA
jgi:hypothetical protein